MQVTGTNYRRGYRANSFPSSNSIIEFFGFGWWVSV